jgi:DNA-binding winged helix-turn-helix (wHTH) protein
MKDKLYFKFNINTRTLYYQEKLVAQLNVVEGRILTALINSSTPFIGRDDLLDIAWPDKDVTPNSLNVAIKKIRAQFFHTVETEVITTHFKKGFSWNHQDVQCDLYDVDADAELSGRHEMIPSCIPGKEASPEKADKVTPGKPLSSAMSFTSPSMVQTFKKSTAKKSLNGTWLSLAFYLLSAFMGLFIALNILFYTTQLTLLSCEHIKGSKFCGYGSVINEDIPRFLPPGNYIYVNSQSNGFQYAEVK